MSANKTKINRFYKVWSGMSIEINAGSSGRKKTKNPKIQTSDQNGNNIKSREIGI